MKAFSKRLVDNYIIPTCIPTSKKQTVGNLSWADPKSGRKSEIGSKNREKTRVWIEKAGEKQEKYCNEKAGDLCGKRESGRLGSKAGVSRLNRETWNVCESIT